MLLLNMGKRVGVGRLVTVNIVPQNEQSFLPFQHLFILFNVQKKCFVPPINVNTDCLSRSTRVKLNKNQLLLYSSID